MLQELFGESDRRTPRAEDENVLDERLALQRPVVGDPPGEKSCQREGRVDEQDAAAERELRQCVVESFLGTAQLCRISFQTLTKSLIGILPTRRS